MYRCMTKLKALVIDIDSFEKIDEDAVNNLASAYKCLFLTSEKEKKNQLVSQFGENAVYFLPRVVHTLELSPTVHGTSLERLGLKTTEIAYLSCDIDFLRQALAFGSGTMWITDSIAYEEISTSPDLILPNLAALVERLYEQKEGFCGENFFEYQYQGDILRVKFPLDGHIEDLYILGRYYPQKHCMRQKNLYSAAIYYNKNSNSKCYGIFEEDFLQIYQCAISRLVKNIEIDGICAVPPHEGEESRFSYIIKRISEDLGITNYGEKLICVKNYPKQKGMTLYERQENIEGVFEYTGNLEDETVLIIDDVVVTGATLKECARALYHAGASKVVFLVLAVNQFPENYSTLNETDIICPKCGSSMKLSINSETNAFFYSCAQYKHSIDFQDGWKQFCDKVNNKDYFSLSSR